MSLRPRQTDTTFVKGPKFHSKREKVKAFLASTVSYAWRLVLREHMLAYFGSGREGRKLILSRCLYKLIGAYFLIDRDPRISSGLDEAFEAVIIYGLGLPIFKDSTASVTSFFLSS